MKTTRIKLYTYILYLLSTQPTNKTITTAIEKIRFAFENHEQSVANVLSHLDPIFQDSSIDADLKLKLKIIKHKAPNINFNSTTDAKKFQNPLRRQLDSYLAINLLLSPTTRMMQDVQTVSSAIISCLESAKKLSPTISKAFLAGLENLKGVDQYKSAISLGSFNHEPTMDEVIDILKINDEKSLATIMHIHFKYALLLSRYIPMTFPHKKPTGQFAQIVADYEKKTGNSYFNSLEEITTNGIGARSYLSDDIIYESPLYKRGKGRNGDLNYTCKTTTLGLMRSTQKKYAKEFTNMPLPWVADAQAQEPDYKSPVVQDLINNDAIYVSGPSGMASLLLGLMENLGNFESIEKKQSYLAAITAYIVGGGFHSFAEVLGPAAYSLDLIPGYHVTLPGDKPVIPPKIGLFFQSLAAFDNEAIKLHENAWQQYINQFAKSSLCAKWNANINSSCEKFKRKHQATDTKAKLSATKPLLSKGSSSLFAATNKQSSVNPVSSASSNKAKLK